MAARQLGMQKTSHEELVTAALECGLPHFGLQGLACLSAASKNWRTKAQTALHEITPAVAQQLAMQSVTESARIPPVETLRPLMLRATMSITDVGVVRNFLLEFVLKLAHLAITRLQPRC